MKISHWLYRKQDDGSPIVMMRTMMWVFAMLLVIRCSSPTAEKKNDQAFDSLVRVVNVKLKTNADSALQASAILYKLTTGTQDAAQVYEAALLRGKAFQATGMNDSAYRYYSGMRKMAFLLNDTARILQTCHILGSLFYEMSSTDSVAFWYEKGLILASVSKDTVYQAVFSTNMGLYYDQKGELGRAMKCFTESARYYEKLDDSVNIAQVYRNIASIFVTQGLYQQAIQFYHRAVPLNMKLGNDVEVGIDYTNLAVAFMMISSDSAGYYYKAAMTIMASKGSVANLLPLKFNYANYLSRLGRSNEAERTYQEVLRISRTNNVLKGQIYSLNNLANCATRGKDGLKANQLFREAIQLAGNNKLSADLLVLYREAFQCNLELRNVDLAGVYFKQWDHLNDSLKTIEQRDAVLKYQALYETQVLETKVKDLNSESRLQRSRTIIIALILLALLLLVSALVILLFFRNRQANQKRTLAEQQALHSEQEKLLKQADLDLKTLEHQLKEDEVERLELEVNLRENDLVYQSLITTELNHVNRSVQEKLGPFQYRFPKKADQEEFGQLLSEIIRESSKNPMNEFEVMFKQMHGGFSEKLLALCPDFSRSELQICGLLRLNLSSKDVARIANLSVATVEITRHHIRKKLCLDQKESLTSYLIQI